MVDHAVIGVPDEDFGQRLAAFVVLRPGADIDETELRKYLKDKVSRFEQPRDTTIVATSPRNPTGKVLRNELGHDRILAQPHRPTPPRAKRRKGRLP